MFDISASIVLFHNDRLVLRKAIDSILNVNLNLSLFLFDNSKNDDLHDIISDDRVIYFYNNKNVGFGKGHNYAINFYKHKSIFHIVINPDIYFYPGNIEKMYSFMISNKKIGLLMPKIKYPNNEIQYLCKKNPTPHILFVRRFLSFKIFSKYVSYVNHKYEFRDLDYNNLIFNVPYLSGCFMFFRMNALNEIGYFDERIFMYIEDADITRRMLLKYNTIYYPFAEVYHHFEKGSHKSYRLMMYSIHGAIVYFNKWGWFN